VYLPQRRVAYMMHTCALAAHIIPAMLTLIIGPFLFLAGSISRSYRSLHRWGGRVYLTCVVIGGLSSFFLIELAGYQGLAWLGFSLVGILWLMTGWMAYRSICKKQVQHHRHWMIRNYALTFTAVTLRLWLGIAEVSHLPLLTSYDLTVWLGWLPNLVVAELIIRYPLRK